MSSMIRKHCHHKRSYGVGLVDVLIAVVIISGGLVAMGRLQGASATSSAVAGQQSEAGFIAQKVIEDLRAKSWASIVPGSYTLQPQVGRSATYNINYTVTDSTAGGPKFKTVMATVSWNDSSNQLQKSTITTRFQENGEAGTVRMLGMNTTGCSSSSGSSSSSAGSSSSSSESSSQSDESKKC
jgi:Tfp pilus assembly protein PilV